MVDRKKEEEREKARERRWELPRLGEDEGGGGDEEAAWRKRKVRYRRNKKNRAKKLKLTLESNVVSGSRMPRVKIKECRARARERLRELMYARADCFYFPFVQQMKFHSINTGCLYLRML